MGNKERAEAPERGGKGGSFPPFLRGGQRLSFAPPLFEAVFIIMLMWNEKETT